MRICLIYLYICFILRLFVLFLCLFVLFPCLFVLFQCLFVLIQCIFVLFQCIFVLFQRLFVLFQCLFVLFRKDPPPGPPLRPLPQPHCSDKPLHSQHLNHMGGSIPGTGLPLNCHHCTPVVWCLLGGQS